MSSNILKFTINAELKDILGRGLIYNDNIAVIELIKNSKDAGANIVKINFSDETSLNDNSLLQISDNGCGMTFDDIRNKWFNVAYSEKRGALKDNGFYAGNKGIGRFSCDRLGKELYLYTKSQHGDYLEIPIDWTKFENKESSMQMSDIPFSYKILERDVFIQKAGVEENFVSGTVLKIKKLRTSWTSKSLLNLISELETFSPTLSDNDFGVFVYSTSDYSSTTKQNREALEDKINKRVESNLLDKLAFKTTYIESQIDQDGKFITTSLYYQGERMYHYKANNPYKLLKNVNLKVHYLDTLSKGYFTRTFKKATNDYGSIFLYYNDHKIIGYGVPGDDWLYLDQRKTQGTSRYFGTRDLVGKVSIDDYDNTFSVMSNREGMVKNDAFWQLISYDKNDMIKTDEKEIYGYIPVIVRQLETFVVEGIQWGRLVDKFDSEKFAIQESDIKKDFSRYKFIDLSGDKVAAVVSDKILKSVLDVAKFDINIAAIKNMSKIAEDKYKQYIDDFVQQIENKSLSEITPHEKGQISKIIKAEKERADNAEKERNIAEEQAIIVEKKLEIEKRRGHLLEKSVTSEKDASDLVHHVIGLTTNGIIKDMEYNLGKYYKDYNSVSKEDLIRVMEDAIKDIRYIEESANLYLKASFDIATSSVHDDIFQFISDYVDDYLKEKWGLKVKFENENNLIKICDFNPVKISIFFINIISNTMAIGADEINISIEENRLIIADNGPGFDFSILSEIEYLERGKSTKRNGSGLGLYHCKEIAEEIGAKIMLSNKSPKGAKIILEFKK